jgi:hypothetical protein
MLITTLIATPLEAALIATPPETTLIVAPIVINDSRSLEALHSLEI